MLKGYKFSEESRRKMSLSHKGKPSARKGIVLSEETRKKISEQKKGTPAWNKGKKLGFTPKGAFKKGNPAPNTAFKKGLVPWNKGKPNPSGRGENNHFWKGGITPENRKIRQSIEFRIWREAVFARDNWTCQKTGIRGGKLHAHHIQNFSQHPDLRFAIDNGITLSDQAHKSFHKKFGTRNNNKEQLLDFINS